MTAENLMNLLDSLTETSVYVIEEESARLLYFNERCRNTGRARAALGIRCDEVWPELCANCPLKMLGDRVSNHMVCYDPLLKLTVDVTANRINWEGRVPAVVITAAPHRLNFEEEQGFQKIRQMYASSLVTVFDECIIANHDQGLLCELPEGCGVGRHTGTGEFRFREPQICPKGAAPGRSGMF